MRLVLEFPVDSGATQEHEEDGQEIWRLHPRSYLSNSRRSKIFLNPSCCSRDDGREKPRLRSSHREEEDKGDGKLTRPLLSMLIKCGCRRGRRSVM